MTDFEKPSNTEQDYFKQKDLELLAELRERRAATRSAEATVRRCPIDGEGLETREYHGVMIDICPKCQGIWLDAGELEALLRVEQKSLGGFLSKLLGR